MIQFRHSVAGICVNRRQKNYMDRRYINLILILVIVIAAVWMVLPSNPGISIGEFTRTMKPVLGLDLRGGMQVLLKPSGDAAVTAQSLSDASKILENRANGLGVGEVVFQTAGDQYILGEFPGLTNTDEVLRVLKQTGQLEFVNLGDQQLPAGTPVTTTTECTNYLANVPAAQAPATPAATETPAPTETPADPNTPKGPFCTIMSGAELDSVSVSTGDTPGTYAVSFVLKTNGAAIFKDYTTNNVGKFLAIVLDKTIVSAPTIQTAITEGNGQISGAFTMDEANNLAVTLRYGSLPVALEVAESREIGATLGEDSLSKSLLAGAIGFAIVFLFMGIYYRLPGLLANLSIIVYALITYSIYLLLPVTITLPGIAGFLLSTGSALDANILFFERMKEELRAGRTLRQSVDLGWKRAWSSIRDSNIATLITSAILFWFGSTYGATIVKGFALTLAIGVAVSVLTAIFVSRTFLSIVVDFVKPADHVKWFGA